MSQAPKPADLAPDEWASVLAAIRAGPERPGLAAPAPEGMRASVHRWCLEYVRSAGSAERAWRAGDYRGHPAPIELALLRSQAVRRYLASLLDAVSGGPGWLQAARTGPLQPQAPPRPEKSLLRAEAAPLAVSEEIPGVADVAEVLRHATNVLRIPPGQFVKVEEGGEWTFDIEAVRAAPAGIIRSIGRDKQGRMLLTFADARDARQQLLDYATARAAANAGRSQRGVREVMAEALAEGLWDAADELSRSIGERIRRAAARAPRVVDVDPDG